MDKNEIIKVKADFGYVNQLCKEAINLFIPLGLARCSRMRQIRFKESIVIFYACIYMASSLHQV